jgi:hypothetical protein
MFFNRLQVEHEDGFYVAHFGLVAKSGLLLDSYSCVLPKQALIQNRQSLLEYLARIGQSKQKHSHSWQGGRTGANTDVADIISMTFRDDLAETCLCVFSMTAAARQPRSSSNDALEAQPLVLLRSSAEMQKQVIEALYAE